MDDGPFGNTTYDGPGSWSDNDGYKGPTFDGSFFPMRGMVIGIVALFIAAVVPFVVLLLS